MAFSLPNFNLVMDTWNNPHVPSIDLPDFSNVPVQLYVDAKARVDITPDVQSDWVLPIFLRVPETHYGDVKAAWIFGLETGHGTAYYKARWKEFMHLGFPNSYFVVLCEQCDNAGSVPYYRNVIY